MMGYSLSPNIKVKFTAAFIFFLLLAGMSCLKYLSLHSSLCDLGIFFSHLHNIKQGQWWILFSGHAWPFLLPYAWLFSLPGEAGPLTILVCQAFFLVLPAYELLKRYTWSAFWGYVLFFPVWYNALFDFHIDHLAVPLLFWFFFLAEDKKYWQCLLPGMLLILVKEAFALQAASCGIFLILSGRKRGTARHTWKHALPAGLLLLLCSSYYFYFVVNKCFPFCVPPGNKAGIQSPAYLWLGKGLGEMALFIFTHPLTVLNEVLSCPQKILYLLVLGGSLAFIPLLKPSYLIPALPILALSLLARSSLLVNLQSQYTAGLIAPLLMGFIHGLQELKSRQNIKLYVLCILLISHILISPSPISWLFWSNTLWNFSANAYWKTPRDKMIKDALTKYIPQDPKITVSSQNTLHWKRLSARNTFLVFPQGVIKKATIFQMNKRTPKGFVHYLQTGQIPTTKHTEIVADYIVLDLQRPWFLYDRGCTWNAQKTGILQLALKIAGHNKRNLAYIPLKQLKQLRNHLDIPPNIPLSWSQCTFTLPPPQDLLKSKSKSLGNLFIHLVQNITQNYELILANKGLLIYKKRPKISARDG